MAFQKFYDKVKQQIHPFSVGNWEWVEEALFFNHVNLYMSIRQAVEYILFAVFGHVKLEVIGLYLPIQSFILWVTVDKRIVMLLQQM